MNDARQVALEQTASMVAAILRRGGTATAMEISAESGLPLDLVQGRLLRNGPAMLRAESRYFRRDGEVWGLTDVGRGIAVSPA